MISSIDASWPGRVRSAESIARGRLADRREGTKKWLLSNATAAAAEIGYQGGQGEDMVVLENTPKAHNLVVCTLCSCYRPSSIIASPLRGVLPPIPYTREAITCRNGSVTLAGTLLVPSGSGPYSAVVFLHGSGSETRDASNFLADRITREGVASLIFDKRGAGASSGDWREATFTDLARDVLACVEVLKVRGDIIRRKIGLAGASQAGWIAPLAASLSPDIAFLALISGPAVPVWREGWWDAEYRMLQRGFGAAEIEKARTILRLNDEVTRSGRAFDELQKLVEAQRAEAWFPALGLPEQLPPPDAPFRRFYRRILDFDPLPILQRMSIPSLWLLGDGDAEMPSEETAAILGQLRKQGKHVTVRMFSGTDHSLFVAAGPSQLFRWPRVVAAYIDAFTEWIKGQ